MPDCRKSISYCLFFCLTLAVIAACDLYISYLHEEDAARLQVANGSYLVSEWIKGAMQNSDYVLRDIVSQVSFTELHYPDADVVRHDRISEFIERKRKTLPDAVGIGLTDKDCIITNTNSKVGVDVSQREWCRELQLDPQRETFVSHMYLSKARRPSITQVRRFPGASPGFYGSAGIAVDLGFFSRWLEKVPVGPHGAIVITDTWLSLLAKKPAAPDMLGKTVNHLQVTEFIASGNSYATFHSRFPLSGENSLYGVRRVDGLPFVIVFGEADVDWLAGWWQRVWGEVVALLLFWGMAIFILREHLALIRQKETLSEMANTDSLAGIANRRYFISRSKLELKRAQRYRSSLAVLMLDIDHFKNINDTHGHATGDQAIIVFVRACQAVLRDTDLLGRFGGDEFAILLPNTNAEGAIADAERLCQEIQASEILGGGGVALSMTSSIGLAMVGADITDIYSALTKADAALYRAKKNGRNCVEFIA